MTTSVTLNVGLSASTETSFNSFDLLDDDADFNNADENSTVPLEAPAFTKVSDMHPSQIKPAGNFLRLKCAAKGA